MFVYQNDKLYVQSGDKMVWVEIYPDHTFTITNEVESVSASALYLTVTEVKAKFNFQSMEPVERRIAKPKTPRTKKKVEVKPSESTGNTKKPVRKRTTK